MEAGVEGELLDLYVKPYFTRDNNQGGVNNAPTDPTPRFLIHGIFNTWVPARAPGPHGAHGPHGPHGPLGPFGPHGIHGTHGAHGALRAMDFQYIGFLIIWDF